MFIFIYILFDLDEFLKAAEGLQTGHISNKKLIFLSFKNLSLFDI